LVVEPLRALISSQIEQLRGRGVNVEQLLSHSDAKLSHELPALDYLQTLVNQYTQHKEDPQPSSRLPLIIFSTPEIIKSPSCLAAIKCLAAKNLLSLVVFDEFDYVDGCHEHFRSSYVNLVSSMKETLQDSSWIPFLFLSATGSSDLIFEQLDTTLQEFSLSTTQRQKMSPPPVLFQTSIVLPRNHIYRG
jgi:superfamily II DNA helicase RecQ